MVYEYRRTLPADVVQTLLDAATEIEGGEHAFADVVEQKPALQRALAATRSTVIPELAIGPKRRSGPPFDHA
ncbi:hypothetical protein [Burkholderia ambifaria]|uniref:hypothetical protein n=1 Tax=Burkholderia ambifaria TaxID=152480 RepID=UPI003391D022